MHLISYQSLRGLGGRLLLTFHPRRLMWEILKKRRPIDPIITNLGKDFKVRIYPYDYLGKQIYIFGMIERAQTKLISNYLKPGMVFFDVGANFGQYTIFASKFVGQEGKVHSFEPSSSATSHKFCP